MQHEGPTTPPWKDQQLPPVFFFALNRYFYLSHKGIIPQKKEIIHNPNPPFKWNKITPRSLFDNLGIYNDHQCSFYRTLNGIYSVIRTSTSQIVPSPLINQTSTICRNYSTGYASYLESFIIQQAKLHCKFPSPFKDFLLNSKRVRKLIRSPQ